jgi:hypothetical protein
MPSALTRPGRHRSAIVHQSIDPGARSRIKRMRANLPDNSLAHSGNEIVDTCRRLRHPKEVPDLRKRVAALVAVVAVVAVVAGLWAPCAGWQTSAEARLSCCLADGSCPMETPDSPGATTQSRVTQADADNCCAAAERSRSTSPDSSSLTHGLTPLAIINGPLAPLPPDVGSERSSSRFVDVAPSPPTPRHLLLSVFLV